ncbi:MAG: T9SS C-terminal target domain-containing protein, partial [Bacteroidota bacterium]|nr:T9SS C-terminal target domain-containing protein [Bacteroidota bacterium]
MKRRLLILLCLPMILLGQNVSIPDANFKAYLVGNVAINTNGDAEIQVSEAMAFNGAIDCNNLNISDLTGIEYFVALTTLRCFGNQLTSLD